MRTQTTFNSGLTRGVKRAKPDPKNAFRLSRFNSGLTPCLLNVRKYVSIEYIRRYILLSLSFSTFIYIPIYFYFSTCIRVRGGSNVKPAKTDQFNGSLPARNAREVCGNSRVTEHSLFCLAESFQGVPMATFCVPIAPLANVCARVRQFLTTNQGGMA